ncbi:type IV toxin-antitoxin system AbiEi family antitoxin domain-containing protein [Phycicoccus flavus]|uniref:type IV toxin-antitoxin system AbiEi family antitoxin domain-containing protein n=1 Tax=Phycicoccus flavus TaxID=2502783 RepID=UPI000FEBCED7|nr:type IV toxin-antitoxin system AbiEi family antitoxin domain-containing protein [Phycicoccus flavus]NHA70309.1 type IV toxin-antitoxin system AbiEi family antitoxin domain-containing protein [Phycicoccus flavus]
MDLLHPDLARLAATQRGVFTTRQARATGVGAYALERLLDQGALGHPCRGLYTVESIVADLGPEDRHRALCTGALLLYPDASFTSVSAVLAHELPVWGAAMARPHLHRPIERSVGVKGFWIRPRPQTPGRPGQTTTGLGPADDVATALVQLAMDHGMSSGVVSADAALHAGRVTRDALEEAVSLVATWPASSRPRAMLTHVDGRSESVGESRCRVDLGVHGISTVPQVEIRDDDGRFVARVDLLVEGTRVVVEFDGRLKYADGDPRVLYAEKAREDRLRALGYVVVRISWADLEAGRVVAKVRRALAVTV